MEPVKKFVSAKVKATRAYWERGDVYDVGSVRTLPYGYARQLECTGKAEILEAYKYDATVDPAPPSLLLAPPETTPPPRKGK